MSPTMERNVNAPLLILGAGIAFATSGPLARYAWPAHPLVIVLGRVALAALALFAIELSVGGRDVFRSLARLRRGQWAGILFAGLVLAGHFSLFVWGLQTTSLPAAVTLISLEPLSVVLWALLLHGARPSAKERVGLALATVGAVLIGAGSGRGEHRLLGDLLVVGAVILYGLYLSVARSLRAALPARQYAAMVYAACAVFSSMAIFVTSLHAGAPVAAAGAAWPIAPHSALAIGALALIPTLIGHTSVQAAARYASPALVALVSPVETLGGIAIGVVWLAAVPSPTEWWGAAIILAGVLVAVAGDLALPALFAVTRRP